MRPIHLLSLQGAALPSGADGPLVLPSLVEPAHHTALLAWFHELTGRPPLVEVDWTDGFTAANERVLEWARRRWGSGGALVSVSAREGSDLAPLLDAPELGGFRHVVVRAAHTSRNARLGLLGLLCRHAEEQVAELYLELATELELDPAAWAEQRAFVQTLLDPIEILETANAVVEVQLEGVAPAIRREIATRRGLSRLLRWRPRAEVAALLGLAAGWSADEIDRRLGDEGVAARISLADQLLTLDGAPARWARLLGDREVVTGLIGPRGILPIEGEDRPGKTLREAVERVTGEPVGLGGRGSFEEALSEVWAPLHSGRFDEARRLLDALDARMGQERLGASARAAWWEAAGVLHANENRLSHAEDSFRRALRLQEAAHAVPPPERAFTMLLLGRVLLRKRRWQEAEAQVRGAIAILIAGGLAEGEGVIQRGAALHLLACCLRDQGRWSEAEPLFREAVTLLGGAPPLTRASTLHHFAVGHRDHGEWSRAESLFREALRLGDEGGESALERAYTLRALAKGLRDHGSVEEADALEADADRIAGKA